MPSFSHHAIIMAIGGVSRKGLQSATGASSCCDRQTAASRATTPVGQNLMLKGAQEQNNKRNARYIVGRGDCLPICLLDVILAGIGLDAQLVIELRLFDHFGREAIVVGQAWYTCNSSSQKLTSLCFSGINGLVLGLVARLREIWAKFGGCLSRWYDVVDLAIYDVRRYTRVRCSPPPASRFCPVQRLVLLSPP